MAMAASRRRQPWALAQQRVAELLGGDGVAGGGEALAEVVRLLQTYKPLHVQHTQGEVSAARDVTDALLKRTNRLLNTKGYRAKWAGLVVLNCIVRQCSSQVFVDCCIEWAGVVCRMLEANDAGVVEQAALLLTYLVRHCHKHSDLRRELANGQLPVILKSCVATVTARRFGAGAAHTQACVFTALAECCACFPGPVRGLISRLEEACLSSFRAGSQLDPAEQEAAVSLFVALLRCTGAKNVVAAWTDRFTLLLGSIVQLVRSELAAVGVDRVVFEALRDGGAGPALPEQPAGTSLLLSGDAGGSRLERVCCLLRCLDAQLRLPYPEAVVIPRDSLVETVCLLLNLDRDLITGSRSASFTTEALAAELDSVHLAAHQVLLDAISQLRYHLLPHLSLVCQLLEQSFLRTKVEGELALRPHRHLRLVCYRTLEMLVVLFGSSLEEQAVASFVKHCLTDCRPVKSSLLSLVDAPPPRKTTSKKRKRAAMTQSYTATVGFQKVDDHINGDLCKASLSCLRALLAHCGLGLAAKPRRAIDAFLVVQCGAVQDIASSPYDMPSCRKALYACLVASLQAPASTEGIDQDALFLLTGGVDDSDFEVMAYCRESLAACDALIHPRFPAMRRRHIEHAPEETEATRPEAEADMPGVVLGGAAPVPTPVAPEPELRAADMLGAELEGEPPQAGRAAPLSDASHGSPASNGLAERAAITPGSGSTHSPAGPMPPAATPTPPANPTPVPTPAEAGAAMDVEAQPPAADADADATAAAAVTFPPEAGAQHGGAVAAMGITTDGGDGSGDDDFVLPDIVVDAGPDSDDEL